MERPEPQKHYSADTIAELMTSLLDPLLIGDAMHVGVRVLGDVIKRMPEDMQREALDYLWIDVATYLFPDHYEIVEATARKRRSGTQWVDLRKTPPSA